MDNVLNFANGTPDVDEKAMALELLVDDELDEGNRRSLLTWAQEQPGAWRDIAVRFLERQVEHRAARRMLGLADHAPAGMAGAGVGAGLGRPRPTVVAGRPTPIYSMAFRIAAMLLITGGVALLVGHALQRSPNGRSGRVPLAFKGAPGRRLVSASVPRSALGMLRRRGRLEMSLPVLSRWAAPRDYPFAAPAPNTSQRVIVVPDGANGAVAFPMREAAYEKVY